MPKSEPGASIHAIWRARNTAHSNRHPPGCWSRCTSTSRTLEPARQRRPARERVSTPFAQAPSMARGKSVSHRKDRQRNWAAAIGLTVPELSSSTTSPSKPPCALMKGLPRNVAPGLRISLPLPARREQPTNEVRACRQRAYENDAGRTRERALARHQSERGRRPDDKPANGTEAHTASMPWN